MARLALIACYSLGVWWHCSYTGSQGSDEDVDKMWKFPMHVNSPRKLSRFKVRYKRISSLNHHPYLIRVQVALIPFVVAVRTLASTASFWEVNILRDIPAFELHPQ